MSSLSRREFSAIVAASPLVAQAQPGVMPLRTLGKIGFKASILGFGAQHIAGTEQANVDRIVSEALEQGLNYVDTAPNYGNSEELVGRALKGKRDRVFLTTKVETSTREQAMGQVRESLRRLQTDVLDCVLLHNIARDDRWPDFDQVLGKAGAFAGLVEARKQGMIRHIGFSIHTRPARAFRAFETGEVDLVLAVLNFVDHQVYHLEERLLPEVRRRNIAIVAMKVLGGPGNRAGASRLGPSEHVASMRYVWGIPGVAVSIIGYRTPAEMQLGLAAAKAYKPLSAEEAAALGERGKALAAEWGPSRGPVS